MVPLRTWLKGKLKPNSSPSHDDSVPGPLPYRDGWPRIQSAAKGTNSHYGFFARLPVEIRRQIVCNAFGDRVIHIDLIFGHPLVQKPAVKRKEMKDERTHCGLGSELVRDTRRPKQWQWFSCVCHRRSRCIDEQGQSGAPGRPLEPCEDGCIPGSRIGKRSGQVAYPGSLCVCESAGYSLNDCFIGVMGWLLACRQAYLDGVDTLYGTNTFHLTSLPLQLSLPRLLPPNHFPTITSLELIWTFNNPNLLADETMASVWSGASKTQQDTASAPSASSRPSQPPSHMNALHTLCSSIPTNFPAVRRLYIALNAHIASPHTFPTVDPLADVERVVLAPVEETFRALGAGAEKEFSLAIQQGAWQAFWEREQARWSQQDQGGSASQDVEHVPLVGGSGRAAIWRTLGTGAGEGGYWLRPGWDDVEAFGGGQYWMFASKWWGMEFKGEF